MNDRELLELAAKSAGYGIQGFYANGDVGLKGGGIWNPLTDDGDALRLAVRLNMHIHIDFDRPERMDVRAYVDGADARETSNDQYAATRRAIARTAAEIGKAMP